MEIYYSSEVVGAGAVKHSLKYFSERARYSLMLDYWFKYLSF
jgi:hypothetical protein